MKVFLIRHAQTKDDISGMTQNDESEIAIPKKEDIERAKSLIGKVGFVYASPMKRAKQTAELLFTDYKEDVILKEYTQPKLLEKLTAKQRNKWWREHSENRINPEWSHDGSESFYEIRQRANNLYKRLLEWKVQGKDSVALVTHSTFMKHFLVSRIKPLYSQKQFYEYMYPLTIENLKVIEIEI